MSERAAPHNLGAEQGLIGAIFTDNTLFERVAWLGFDAFFDPLHARIWELCTDMIGSNGRADPITLRTHFGADEIVDETRTVWQYLGRLVAHACVPASIGAYARQVQEMATRRRLVVLLEDAIAAAYEINSSSPLAATIGSLQDSLHGLTAATHISRELGFDVAVDQALAIASNAYSKQGALAGIPTGLRDLDRSMGGLQASDLVVLAGRPSMGKTALATNIAVTTARGTGHDPRTGESFSPRHVHFFSQEMSAAQLAMRVISEVVEISSDKLRRGDVDERQIEHVLRSRDRLAGIPMTIDETGGITLAALAQKARRIKRRFDTGLIVVDYIQLMSGGARSTGNRVQEISAITAGLKALAKDLDVPILALSQLSRKVEERSDKRPQLADLRESGAIEQDADVVMFVYRDDYYLHREEPDESDFEAHAKWSDKVRNASGKAEVIIAKARHAGIGRIELSFQAELTRFANLAREHGHG